MLSIINIIVYAIIIDIVAFNACSHFDIVKIVLKISFQEVKHITFLLILVRVAVDYTIYNIRKNEFIFSYLEQLVIDHNIFI